MSDLEVRLICREGQLELSADPEETVVASQPIILSVSGHASVRMRIDGQEKRLSNGQTGVVAVDLSRSTGFHRVDIGAETRWFATQDSKLGLNGTVEMLQHLRTLGTAWSGQLLFSDGTGYRDPHVVYGWLDGNADAALDVIETVLASPRTEEVTISALSRRGGGAVLTKSTLRLLRSAPKQHLTQRPAGLLPIGGSHYDPNRVVSRRRQRTVETVPNRRLVQVIGVLEALLQEVISAPGLSANARARCRIWRERVQRLASYPLSLRLLLTASVLAAPPQGAELVDPDYMRSYRVALQVHELFGWAAHGDTKSFHSFVQSADRIYQAYAAFRVADALDLRPTSPLLGSQPLAFTNDSFELYYDTICPPHVMSSWRAKTTAPDESRPDLLLVQKATKKVAILDAKYRIGPHGGASEDSRKEVSAYQALYDLRHVTILFPDSGAVSRVLADQGRSIIETPLYGVGDNLSSTISETINRLEAPGFPPAGTP